MDDCRQSLTSTNIYEAVIFGFSAMRYLFIAAPFVLLAVVIWGLGITGIAARRTQLTTLWNKHIAESRRERNFIASFAFFITFGILRWITTSIHAGSSSFFHDVHTSSGLHIHHLVWGILGLLLVGYLWLLEIGTGKAGTNVWAGRITCVLFAVSAALTLDEFALWLHLADVYWGAEGKASIRAAFFFGSLLSAGMWGHPFVVGIHKAALAGRRQRIKR
jgi:hypothetical protein